MKPLFIALLIFFSSTSFRAGSGTAYLVCKSESGRTIFTAALRDIQDGLESAELSVDGVKLTFTSEDKLYSIFDPGSGVFTLYIEGKPNQRFPLHRFLKFWAIPKTFKTLISEDSHQKYQFKAIIYGTEPRKDKQLLTPEVELTCTLEYEI